MDRLQDRASDSRPRALSGVRVLEIGDYIAGPYCGLLLADLGAEVIKIENASGGDSVRSFAPHKDGQSSAFSMINRNKRSLAIDLKTAEGKAIIDELVLTADILVENLRPGTMTRLGLGYSAVSAQNPALIYVSASGWGQDGPLSALAGLDIMAQARSGIMSVTGEVGGLPTKVGVPLCDLGCAMYAATAALAALHHRTSTGEGQHIDVSLFETGVSFAVWEFAKYSVTGAIPRARGSAHQSAAPYQAVRTADGWVTIGAATPRTWTAMCIALGLDSLIEDARFINNALRMQHREDLIDILELRLSEESSEHWIALLEGAGVPAAPLNDYGQVFDDAHLAARDFFWEASDSHGTSFQMMGSPMRLSATPARRDHPAPRHGEDTTEILKGLGRNKAAVADLLARGIATAPSEPKT